MKTKDILWLLAGFTLGWIGKGIYEQREKIKRDWNQKARVYWQPMKKGQLIPKITWLDNSKKPPKGSKRVLHENHPGGRRDIEDTIALRLIEEGKTLEEAWLVVLQTEYNEVARQDSILVANDRRNFMRRIKRKRTKTTPP